MNRDMILHYLYRVIGNLEAMTMMKGHTVNEAMITVLADCADKLEIVGAQLLAKDVKPVERAEEDDWPKEDWSSSY